MTGTTRTMIADLRRRLGLAMGALAAMTLPALADICETQQFEGVRYAVCTVTGDRQDRLRLWLDDAEGIRWASSAPSASVLPPARCWISP